MKWLEKHLNPIRKQPGEEQNLDTYFEYLIPYNINLNVNCALEKNASIRG